MAQVHSPARCLWPLQTYYANQSNQVPRDQRSWKGTVTTKTLVGMLVQPRIWRWRNHNSDFTGKKSTKLGLANRSSLPPPEVSKSQPFPHLNVMLLGSAEKDLLRRELWWQNNLGTLFTGLNKPDHFPCRKKNLPFNVHFFFILTMSV